mgnify:CR=1 FL=1
MGYCWIVTKLYALANGYMARSIRIIILSGLLLTALAALLLPLLLNAEPVRRELAQRLGYHLESEISLEKIEPLWLPTPHLLVRGIEITRPGVRLLLPKIHIFPQWRPMLRLRFEPQRVLLENPSLSLTPALLSPEGKSPPSPPPLLPRTFKGELRVVGGSFELERTELPRGAYLQAIVLDKIDGLLQLSPKGLNLELSAIPSFGRSLEIWGEYTPDSGVELHLNGRTLQLHHLLEGPFMGVSAGLEAEANLDLHLLAKSPRRFEATLKGELPCLLVDPLGQKEPDGPGRLECGFARLALSRSGENWQFIIHDFEAKDPEMRLSGSISRRIETQDQLSAKPLAESPAESIGEPFWEIDIKGRDLDAGALRRLMLETLGDFEVPRKIGEIVLDGRASRASFHFAGPEGDFSSPREFTRKFKLEVEVERAEIMVPEVDLHLPQAWGLLRIEDGLLHLPRAYTRRGESRGEGELKVGLLKANPVLQLNMQLDADVEELVELLPRLIKHPRFQAEMERFSQARGRASGSLYLGESWRDFKVEVLVEQLQAGLLYNRLPWPIEIDQARARITQDNLRWSQLSGTVGPHLVEESEGEIAITPQADFKIDRVQGRIDGAAMLRHFLDYPKLEPIITPVLSRMEGAVTIEEAKASGQLFQPAGWRYQTRLRLDRLQWFSPLLAAEVKESSGIVELTHDNLKIFRLKAEPAGNELELNAELKHLYLHKWQGRSTFKGRLNHQGRQWLELMGWLPQQWLPLAGVRFEPLTIQWREDTYSLAGSLLGGEGQHQTRLEFSADSPSQSAGKAVEIRAELGEKEERAEISLTVRDRKQSNPQTPPSDLGPLTPEKEQANNRKIDALTGGSFKGSGNLDSLGHFFPFFNQGLKLGSWRGEISFELPDSAAPSIKGDLLIENLRWSPRPDDRGHELNIPRVQLSALPSRWRIHQLDVELITPGVADNNREQNLQTTSSRPPESNPQHTTMPESSLQQAAPDKAEYLRENLSIKGEIIPKPSFLELKLELSSPLLRRQTLNIWSEEFKKLLGKEELDGTGNMLSGVVEFNLGKLISAPSKTSAATGDKTAPSTGPEIAPATDAKTNPLTDPPSDKPITLTQLRGRLLLPHGEAIRAEIDRGGICCLDLSGTWSFDPAALPHHLKIVPACEQTPSFEMLLPCLGVEQRFISGDCLLQAEITGSPGKWQSGGIRISSPGGGRILRLKLLSRIFSLLNLTDIVSGGISNPEQQGFAYQSLDIEASIKGENKLIIDKAVLKGDGLNLFARGSINLADYQADITILVAPLKTLDALVGWLPLVGRNLVGDGGSLITIPVRLKGDIREPELTPLSPEAVGEGILNLVESTLLLPFKIISP